MTYTGLGNRQAAGATWISRIPSNSGSGVSVQYVMSANHFEQMGAAYSEQNKQLEQVHVSHLKVVAEKDRQLEELTQVLTRQTQQLRKHRLNSPVPDVCHCSHCNLVSRINLQRWRPPNLPA
jgi:hypothetical protein